MLVYLTRPLQSGTLQVQTNADVAMNSTVGTLLAFRHTDCLRFSRKCARGLFVWVQRPFVPARPRSLLWTQPRTGACVLCVYRPAKDRRAKFNGCTCHLKEISTCATKLAQPPNFGYSPGLVSLTVRPTGAVRPTSCVCRATIAAFLLLFV